MTAAPNDRVSHEESFHERRAQQQQDVDQREAVDRLERRRAQEVNVEEPDDLPPPRPGEDPAQPSYHWHSVVQQRGWEQPTLDGTNGGQDPHAWLWRHQQEHQRRHRPRLDTATAPPQLQQGRPNR